MHKIISMLTRCRPYFPDPEDLYKLFRSKGRSKILLLLIEKGPMTVIEMKCHEFPVNFHIYRELHILEEMGLVKTNGSTRDQCFNHPSKIWAVKYD